MKTCIVCGHAVKDGGQCPVWEGGDTRENHYHKVFVICDKPLCDFCKHGHGEHDETNRAEFAGFEHGTSEWAQMKRHNLNEAKKVDEAISDLNTEQLSILDHTMHRAAGGLYCGDSPDMEKLVANGFMVSAGRKSFVPSEYFRMTGRGREALKKAGQA